MSWELILTTVITVLSVVLAPFLYIWKGVVQRIERLEEDQKNKVDKSEVKELIEYRLDPIKDDLLEIKTQINTLIQHLIDKK